MRFYAMVGTGIICLSTLFCAVSQECARAQGIVIPPRPQQPVKTTPPVQNNSHTKAKCISGCEISRNACMKSAQTPQGLLRKDCVGPYYNCTSKCK
jgi:hypothetical protein